MAKCSSTAILPCIVFLSGSKTLAVDRQPAIRWRQSHAGSPRMNKAGKLVLQREGGREFDAYLAQPEAARAPSIIIFTEMFGLSRHNFAMADHYAERGFNALVPSLFWRSQYPGELGFDGLDRDAAWARLAAFDVEAAGGDIVTAVKWLRSQPSCNEKVFALGFCAGGRMAFVAAGRGDVDCAGVVLGQG